MEKKKTPKLFREYVPPRTENAFLVSRKESYSIHASGCPMTGWISTWEFAKVITSIILLPWQPQNTHSGLMSHCRAEAAPVGYRAPSLQGATALPAEGKRTQGAPAAPAVPTSLVSRLDKQAQQWHLVWGCEDTGFLALGTHVAKWQPVFGDAHQTKKCTGFFFPPTEKDCSLRSLVCFWRHSCEGIGSRASVTVA